MPTPLDTPGHSSDAVGLEAFLPGMALRRLAARGDAVAGGPWAERVPTVVLYVDISGFTALTEDLALAGPRGAEDVREVLNTCFAPLIDLITRHGGEVDKFAGDATLALWPAESLEALAEAVERATVCALDVRAELDALDVRPDFRLRLRQAVTCGDAWLTFVGGVEDRWETLDTGEALAQLGHAMDQSRPGDIVLSSSAWRQLGERATGEAVDHDCWRLDRFEPSAEAMPAAAVEISDGLRGTLARFVPFTVQSRIEAGHTGWLAEFRRVSLLFTDLTGLELDAEGSLDRLQKVIQTVQRSVYRLGGSVNQLMTDDKGTCLIAAWGLAFRNYDDNAVRALRAALAIRRQLEPLGVSAAVGVASGQIYTGPRGNRRRMEYAMIGDAVNLAARLMQRAPDLGGVVCDRYTMNPADGVVEFEKLGTIEVKGKAKPIQIFRPLGLAKIQARQNHEVIGRHDERRILGEHFDALLDGHGTTVVVEGEAGIGKSHLVDELVDRARAHEGARVVASHGDAIERARALFPWRDIFVGLLGLEGDDDAQREAFFSHLREDEHDRAPLLEAALPFDLADTEVTERMSAKGRAEARRELMVELIRRLAARGPLMIVMEDAQWLDSASWDLLEAVHREVDPVLLVIASRPLRERDITAECRRLLDDPEVEILRLGPLDPRSVLDLVRLRLGADALPESLAEMLLTKAEGHPFFTEELAYSLRDQGLIRVVDGRCVLSDEAGSFGSLSFPDTAQGVVTGRIDNLNPQQQLTLKVASVMGRRFESSVLAEVHPIADDRPHLPTYLDALSELELIHPVVAEPVDAEADAEVREALYMFKHSITQEAAYELLPFAQRRELHRSVAEWHENHQEEDLASVFALLAHHWTSAEVSEKALHYLEKAGEQAERNYAYKEVARFFARALELDEALGEDDELDYRVVELSPRRRITERIARRARWRRLLGNAKANLGQLEDGSKELVTCLHAVGERVPDSQRSWIFGLLRQIWRQGRHQLRPQRVYQVTGEAAECFLGAAQAYSRLGAYYYVSNRRLPFMFAMLAGLNAAEHAPPSPELALGYADVCNVAGLIPIHRLARHYVRLALEAAERVDDLAVSARVLSRTGIYLTVVSDPRVVENLERSLDMAERLGDPYQWEESAFLLGMRKYFSGAWTDAADLAIGVIERSRRSGTLVHEIWGAGLAADCALHLADLDGALTWADEGPAADRRSGWPLPRHGDPLPRRPGGRPAAPGRGRQGAGAGRRGIERDRWQGAQRSPRAPGLRRRHRGLPPAL